MRIHKLSNQVINQIAAGEIVERPASVVKELIENSLDAGANNIDIFIEKGGIRLIRIRDNGCGLHKEDFKLALVNHATSKIYTVDDLNHIESFGFRGEALASLCSVSKLQLTSRIENNDIAYYTYVEGHTVISNSNLPIIPTAHPIGTTLEIMDLFYNTPARRRVLRTETREFAYIDEVVRRVALARFDVTIKLVHNGKLIRYYHRIKDHLKVNRRLADICGRKFYSNNIYVNLHEDGLKLYGWITNLSILPISQEIRYFYVNGRIVQNRLMNNAIRKAYQNQNQPQNNIHGNYNIKFVLYLEINSEEVDINVHPNKRDVRFYKGRLVHDFIYQGINNSLIQHQNLKKQSQNNNTFIIPFSSPVPLLSQENATENKEFLSSQPNCVTLDNSLYLQPFSPKNTKIKNVNNNSNYSSSFGRVLTILRKVIALVEDNNGLMLIALSIANKLMVQYYLDLEKNTIQTKNLIFPFPFKIDNHLHKIIRVHNSTIFKKLGIILVLDNDCAILRAVPPPLLKPELHSDLIPELLRFISDTSEFSVIKIAKWIINHVVAKKNQWNITQATDLLVTTAKLYPHLVADPPGNLLQRLNLEMIFQKLNIFK
ncbi:MAG: DNA mismatch repair endonuclease MutL [Candidatus Dasytiphilus stammeri]